MRTKERTFIFRRRKGNMAALGFFRAIRIACVSLNVVFAVGLAPALAHAAAEVGRTKYVEDVLRTYERKIVVSSDLDKEVVEHLGTTEGNESPGRVVADFNGDGVKDVAVLTKKEDGTELSLRMFLCRPECKQVSRVSLGEFEGLQYITLVPSGATARAADTFKKSAREKPMKLRHAGIKYWVFGRTNAVYFWDRKTGKLISVTTGD